MTRQPQRKALDHLGKAHLTMLAALLRYHVLTGDQLTKLLYSPTWKTWVKYELLRLYHAGYVERAPIATRQGQAPLCYAVTSTAVTALRAAGLTEKERGRPYRVHRITEGTLAHNLAVAEMMIAAERLVKAQATLELARLLHDLDLQRTAQPFIASDGRPHKAIPDAYLDFIVREEGGYRRPIWLEIDRGSENEQRFRNKIRMLIEYTDSAYREHYGRRAVTIAIVAVGGTPHLAQLTRWTEAELEALGAQDLDRFRLAALRLNWDVKEAQRPSPVAIYREPVWYRPFHAEPVVLLSKV